MWAFYGRGRRREVSLISWSDVGGMVLFYTLLSEIHRLCLSAYGGNG